MPPNKAERRPLTTTGALKTNSPDTTIQDTSDVARLLELSAERDAWLERVHAAFREGYDLGWLAGHDAGWAAADDYDEREHQAVAARVLETPQQSAARRLRGAGAGCRRDAAEHWRARWRELYRLSRDERFVREAAARDPLLRDYAMTMALLLRGQRGAV